MTYKRKLIEVALPLEAINRESAREKSIRHGHPSTFHLWWARRPLAACRAVLFASLVDDPSAHPADFPTEEAQQAERERLFRIIEELVKWENTRNETVLQAARNEILRSCDGNPPPVLDPFCGAGSIPLEAQRLGLEAHASDLNPVAVLITKALIEIPPKWAGRSAVHPEAEHRAIWHGAEGLTEDVRHYGEWMNAEALRAIGTNYPDVEVPGHGRVTVIAGLWARNVTCPNPACGTTMPLINAYAVSRKRGREAWLDPVVEPATRTIGFKIRHGPGCPPGGTVSRTGATCLACGSPVPLAYVRAEGKAGRMAAQLLCTIAAGDRQRIYVAADNAQIAAADAVRPAGILETELPYNPRAFTTNNYGISKHWQLFTNRQLVALVTFCDLVSQARERVVADGGAPAYADAVATYLSLAIGRLANRCSSQSFWHANGEKVEQVFGRNALPMIWVYAEANPFSESSGNFLGQLEYLVNALERTPARGYGMASQADAAALIVDRPVVVVTDPPYYDNVPYADLSDFFYVWFRRCAGPYHPELFRTLLVPKAEELIAEPARQGSWKEAAKFFEKGLRTAFSRMLDAQDPAYPFTVFYAFKQAESLGDGEGGEERSSTGWETMLQALLDAGALITGTWPVRTEQSGGLREVGRSALASSIALVCRPRPIDAPLATRKDLVAALKAELPDALRHLQQGSIAPVDLAQAAIGPGMGVFSRYSKVVEADGRSMTVRTALGLINQVLDETLAEQESDFDADTRWALAWFEQFGTNPGPFGVAETLSKAKNTAVNALVVAGFLESKGGKVRLLDRDQLAATWDPATDTRLAVWEVTQHLMRVLESDGETAAAELLRRLGGLGETARELAYRLYVLCERKKWAKEALAYNGLVVAWPEIARLAAGEPASGLIQETLL